MKLTGWVLTAALSAVAGSAFAGDVTVKLEGVQARGGQILVSLQTRDEFMQPRSRFGAIAPGDRPGEVVVTLKDVPAGDYALMAMHDANGDYQMQRQPNGVPLEGWAMSGRFTPDHAPTFDEVKVSVGEGGGVVAADMVYP
jgi:uncharacterized protein (DUF2141 family)